MKTYKITDYVKFNLVDSVELDFHKGGMKGDVEIEYDGKKRYFSGEHGSHDYEEDYGFIIVDEEEKKRLEELEEEYENICNYNERIARGNSNVANASNDIDFNSAYIDV